jgi:iron transport multicopper oxidase
LGDGANYAFFNDITYVSPKVPTVFSAMTLGDAAANSTVYGVNSNAHVLKKGQVIELIVNNQDPGKHPFHLHGHNFQIIERSKEEAGDAPANVTDDGTPDVPVKRDTISLWPNGHARIRFVADNPGIWLFHCHIEWYVLLYCN